MEKFNFWEDRKVIHFFQHLENNHLFIIKYTNLDVQEGELHSTHFEIVAFIFIPLHS